MPAISVEPVTMATRDPAPPLPTGKLAADPVPDAAKPKPISLVRLALPIVMVVAVLGMVALMVLGGGERQLNPMMLMFPLLMLASVAMMFNPGQAGQDPDETRRTYLRHLKVVREAARDQGAAQRANALHRHPHPGHLAALVPSRRLWERAAGDPDALEVRVGTGPVALCTPIEVPESPAPEDLDPVCAVSLRQTVHAVGQLPEMPVVIQLQAFRFIGLSGPGARDLARALVAQLVVAHGPETLGISVLGEGWDWVKWLPHTKDPRAARFHILLVDSVVTTGLEDFFEDPGLTTIIDVAALRTTALGVRAEQEGLFLLAEPGGLRVMTQSGDEPLGAPDGLNAAQALNLARRLAPCRRPAGTVATRTAGGDLLGLLGCRDLDDLAANLWPGRAGAARLNVPVGVDSDGLAVHLDIKESAHGGVGPHGLCVGATGSGKSEMLRSLVTSLAATHSPSELNLVLVDFKGGATFLGCETLPHTSAVITNLEDEAPLVERMYDALSGELNRRQEVLRRAGNFANVTDYNLAAASGAHPPMPALVIVVDEFSELLGQHPDFAELFVAVGRLGRSLHVHLLLASQRLEEGRLRGLDSHLSYRFGLKTFSAAESRQVLGVADAYSLPSKPGAGYLKTSSDELVRLQASYVSGPLTRRISAGPARAGRVVDLFRGWEPDEAVVEEETVVDESTTLFDAVVDLAAREAAARGESAHQIWLPPLPAAVELSAVAQDNPGPLKAAVGLIDRPYQQRQDPLILDLGSAGGHVAVAGGPQSGKSGALASLVGALAVHHSPQQVRFYVIDLGGGRLNLLARLPHVAGVAGRDNPDTVRRVIDELEQIIEDAGGQEPEGHTFLILDGWHHIGVAGAEFEDLAERITHLAADGPSARVHLVVSTPRWTAMRPGIRDLIGHRVELRLGEALESLIDRKAQQKLPAAPGRGITSSGEFMLVARTAPQDIAHIGSLWAGAEPAPRLRVLPPRVEHTDLDQSGGSQALGIGGPRLSQLAWDPARHAHLVCVGSSGSGKSNLLSLVAGQVAQLPREEARLVVVDLRRAHLGELPAEMVAAYAASTTAAEEALRAAARTLKERLPGPEVTAAQLAARSWWSGPDIYLVIDDVELVPEPVLHPLLELLPHAGDIGLHVVVARKAGGIGRAMFGGFIAALKDQQPAAVVLDADKDEGAIFGVKPTPQPAGRGRLVLRGEDQGLIQLAVAGPGEMQDAEDA